MADKIATRQAYSEFLVEEGARNPKLVVMTADLSGSNKTDAFEKAYPERFIDSGISEQDMMAEAAGIAHSGHVVCASSFTMFAAGRAYEIIRNSIGYTGANVKVCATHGGITVGEDGASHQTFEDISLMREIPGMMVVNPADAVSTKILLKQIVDAYGPAYVRLGRSGVPVIYDEGSNLQLGQGNILKDGEDVSVLATGIMVDAALQAAKILEEQGISARIVDIHTIKPLDEELIIRCAKETGRIVTAEEHSVLGGLGGAVAEVVVQNCPVKMAMVGQKDCFGESGKPADLLKKYGMTADDIVAAVKSLM